MGKAGSPQPVAGFSGFNFCNENTKLLTHRLTRAAPFNMCTSVLSGGFSKDLECSVSVLLKGKDLSYPTPSLHTPLEQALWHSTVVKLVSASVCSCR